MSIQQKWSKNSAHICKSLLSPIFQITTLPEINTAHFLYFKALWKQIKSLLFYSSQGFLYIAVKI